MLTKESLFSLGSGKGPWDSPLTYLLLNIKAHAGLQSPSVPIHTWYGFQSPPYPPYIQNARPHLLPEEKWCGTQTSIRLDGFFTPNRNVFEVRALQRAKLEGTRLYAWIPGWERETSPRVNAPEALGCTAAVQASDVPLLHLRDWRSQARPFPNPISHDRCFSFLHYLTTSFP